MSMLQLVKQITAAGAVSISNITDEHNRNCKITMRCVYAWYSFMHDMGVAIVDCAILIVYTACLG